MVDLIREIDDTVLHAWMVSISALPIAPRVPLGRIKKKIRRNYESLFRGT